MSVVCVSHQLSLFFVVASSLSCQLDCAFSLHRGNDSWCFFSVGMSTSSGLFMAPSKTSWSFIASKTLTLFSLSVFSFCSFLLNCSPPSRTMTTHIMEIYFRAWKKASGDFLEQIESSCIQDFMQNAIFLHRSSPVHAKVRQVDSLPSVMICILYCVELLSDLLSLSCRLLAISTQGRAVTQWTRCSTISTSLFFGRL